MLAAAFRGLRRPGYGISQLSPTSPLFWEGPVLDAILDTVERNVPLAILPEPNAGVSAPYTLAGLLTMNNAECLSGLAMIQLLKPGPRSCTPTPGPPPTCAAARPWSARSRPASAASPGRSWPGSTGCPATPRRPTPTTTPTTSRTPGRRRFSLLAAVGAGNDLIVNCGMFATGMTCSHEQLLMDEEIAGMCRRLAQGLEVNDETIAADLMRVIGPRGTGYLTAPHTLERLRSKEYYVPRLAVRGPRAAWEAGGSKDTYQQARARARELGAKGPASLDARRREQLNAVLASLERHGPITHDFRGFPGNSQIKPTERVGSAGWWAWRRHNKLTSIPDSRLNTAPL